MDKQSKSRLWTVLAALAAVMWGISGLFAESLFKVSNTNPINYLWDCFINYCDSLTPKAIFSFKR